MYNKTYMRNDFMIKMTNSTVRQEGLGSMKKAYSLKYQLSWIVAVGYLSLLLLLVIFDCYAIYFHRERVRQRAQQGLERYIESLETTIENMESSFIELALGSSEFAELTQLQTGGMAADIQPEETGERQLRMYGHVYTITERMKSKVHIYEGLEGYCFSFNQNAERRYVFEEGMDSEEAVKLAAWHTSKSEKAADVNSWELVQTRDGIYYVRYYKNEMAAISGFLQLSGTDFDFSAYMEQEPEIFWEYNGELIWNTERAGIVRKILDGEGDGNYSLYSGRIGTTQLSVHLLEPNSLSAYVQAVPILLLLITLFSFAFSGYLYLFLKRQMVRPLENLMDSMNRIRMGERELPDQEENRILEFGELENTFRLLLLELRQQKIEAYEEKLNNQRVEMQYLQMQLKPHFFLNCLKTLNALSANGKYDRMQELIYHISAHLRFLLYCDQPLIPLGQEMDYVANYVKLQNEMGLRKMRVETDFEEGLMDCPVPPLLVQTFVENSYKYAKLTRGQEWLTIKIRGIGLSCEGEMLLDLTVADDGTGYPEDVLKVLNGRETGQEAGIGISNLKKRCWLLYGERCEYLFENQGGAVSEVILPCREDGGLAAEGEAAVDLGK